MNDQAPPAWFIIGEEIGSAIHERVASAVEVNTLPTELKFAPLQAHWFILDSLSIANQANRDGMHANALLPMRQCIEAMSIIELGLCRATGADAELGAWRTGKRTPGELRKWLSSNVWPSYGTGLWTEPWTDFMKQLAGAVQSYAHYTDQLAQWQIHLLRRAQTGTDDQHFIVRLAPRAYDPQKATRITLFHAILQFSLARIWLGTVGQSDAEFKRRVQAWENAIGASKYLDGHQTDWGQQFWSMIWLLENGTTILE